MLQKIQEIVKGLNECEAEKLKRDGYTNSCFFNADGTLTNEHKITFKEKKKFFYIDFGTSGAFMVDKSNGEIYNIKAYGQIDKNKKLKADLGNINNADVKVLHSKKWNYLR